MVRIHTTASRIIALTSHALGNLTSLVEVLLELDVRDLEFGTVTLTQDPYNSPVQFLLSHHPCLIPSEPPRYVV